MNEKTKNIHYYYSYLFSPKINTITFSASTKDISSRYKAIMHYIAQNGDPSVRVLSEVEIKKYNSRMDEEETSGTVYRVSQNTEFKINENINGKVYFLSKDKTEYNGKVQYVEYQNLEISSQFLSLKELTKWVDETEKEYKKYLKSKMLETQNLIEVHWDPKDNYFNPICTPWESNVTFENRFFSQKEEILSKINFFLNNESWYKERGIPYTLGILLWGEPGCGKTGFIKALMNLTKRHGIDIKLSKKMDMTLLKEIIQDEEITHDLLIPQNKRILLFEDIDAMGDLVKDRDLPKDSVNIEQITECVNQALSKKMRRGSRKSFDENDISEEPNTEHNNLSYFLNIIDGLHECPGRIIIMTTNKPEYLDKALIRPGRIDFKINMTKATVNDIKEILAFYWSSELDINIIESASEKLSHAEIISCCRLSDNLENSIKKIYEIIDSQDIDKGSVKSENEF